MATKKAKIAYNEEAAALCKVLKAALSFNKDADVITHGGLIMVHTPVGVVFSACSFELSYGIKARDLYNALNKAVDQFTIVEDGSQVIVAWGKKRAAINTFSKLSVHAVIPDPVSGIDVPTGLSMLLHDVLKDLNDNSPSPLKPFLFLTNGAIFWANGNVAAMIQTNLSVPDAIIYTKDLKAAMSYDSDLVNIGGSHSSITLYYADGTRIKIPTVDDSSVKYPVVGVTGLFQSTLYETSYDLTEEHLDALEYVANFADNVIFIQPTHIGTHESPDMGAAVATVGLPLDLAMRPDIMSFGGFKRAQKLIKASGRSRAAFYTHRPQVTFCFSHITVARAQAAAADYEPTHTNNQTAELNDDLPF